jgi:hypothetical protein
MTIAVLVTTFIRADAPDLICSHQEIWFFKAEAYLRGLGVAKKLVTSNNYFQLAIEANMIYYDVALDDITTFLAQDEL